MKTFNLKQPFSRLPVTQRVEIIANESDEMLMNVNTDESYS